MSFEQDKINKVIERVEKMLRLANNAGTEAEANTAAAMAQEMLAAYNLEMADINLASDNKPRADEVRLKEKTTKVALYQWQKTLWEAIAEANYCWYKRVAEYHYNKKNQYVPRTFHHYLIGGQANVVTTRLMGEYLESTISRLCPFTPGRDSSKSWNSWKEGCAARLAERLREKKAELVRESEAKARAAAADNTCTAISLVNVQQREDDLNYAAEHGEEALQRRLCYRMHNVSRENGGDYTIVEGCETCIRRKKFAEEYDNSRALPPVEEKKETEAQRKKREAADEKRWQKRCEREEARNRRHWAKKDMGAYYQGAESAETIGLDTQVGAGRETKKIGGGQ